MLRLPLLSLVWLSLAIADEGATATRYIYINGGNTEMSNYGPHETHLLTWYNTVFGKKGVLLNAGGPGTLVNPSGHHESFDRDDDGGMRLVPSGITMPTLPATKLNIREQISRMGKEGAKKAFIVYNDHGGPDGPRVWLADGINANELGHAYRDLPKDLLVRSFHDHCYAGAGLVDPKRTIPKDAAEWRKYLDKYYPPNVCGLAMSYHDELGEYLEWNREWKDSEFLKVVDPMKNPRLSAWKTKLEETDQTLSLPVATSDYLLEDLFHHVCKTSPRKPAHASDTVTPARSENHEDRCKELHENSELNSANEKFWEAKKLYTEAGEVKSLLARRFAEEQDYEAAITYDNTVREIERLKAEYLIKRDDKGKLSDSDQKEFQETLANLRSPFFVDYLRKLKNIADGNVQRKEFEAYLTSAPVKKWLAEVETQKQYPRFSAFIARKENKGKYVTVLRTETVAEADALQLKRKQIARYYRDRVQKFMRTVLEGREDLKPVLDRLKEIEKCEDSKVMD